MSSNGQVIGAAEMGNVTVGNPNMRSAIEAEAAKWAQMHADSIAKAAAAKAAMAGGTNDSGEVAAAPPPAKPHEPLTMDDLIAQLLREALIGLKREPTDCQPRLITFDTAGSKELCGRRPLRKTVAIYKGSANVTWSNTHPNLAENTDEVSIITAGDSLSIDTEGPIWGKAAVGTTIQVLETYWDVRKIAAAVADVAAYISRKVQPTI